MTATVKGIALPPQGLIFMDHTAQSGFASGQQRVRRVRQFGVRLSSGRVLDLGCGWGRMAYALLDAGFSGKYVGLDPMQKRIAWLQKHFTTVDRRFRFAHLDVKNDRYNADGSNVRVELAPLTGGPVNVALAFSVFTHLYEAQILDYLEQARDLLAPDGVFLFTAFLMNQEARDQISRGGSRHTLNFQLNDHCWHDREDPLYCISYSEEWLRDRVRDAGLELMKLEYGHWCGRDLAQHPNHQDWLLVRRG